MSTNRSLNKLEFKAHMSIHNKVAVPDEETHESSYTRDRFQKKHRISDDEGSSRIRRIKKNLAVLALLPAAQLFMCSGTLMAKPNTDIHVDSSEFGETDLDARLHVNSDEDKFGIRVNESTAVGFNEDGDPNLSMRY